MKLIELIESDEIIHKDKLWIDDIRPSPDETWDIATTYNEAIDKLTKFKYRLVSFDHDLGDFQNGREMTGYDILLWIVEQKMNGRPVPQQYNIHSANPVGRDRMKGVIERYLQQ